MLLHELSCPIVRLLLGVLMLKDAGRNYYAVPGVAQGVTHESRHLADDGHKALIHKPRHFARVRHTLVPPHRNVHSFCLPPFRPAQRNWRATLCTTCMVPSTEVRRELPRTPLPGTSVHKHENCTYPLEDVCPMTQENDARSSPSEVAKLALMKPL